MPKFRKKPIVIEAFQMTNAIWKTNEGWPQWAREAWDKSPAEGAIWCDDGKVYCGTLEGVHEVTFDDWIIKGVKEELYPCKPDIFEATYEPVGGDGP